MEEPASERAEERTAPDALAECLIASHAEAIADGSFGRTAERTTGDCPGESGGQSPFPEPDEPCSSDSEGRACLEAESPGRTDGRAAYGVLRR